MNFLPLKLAAVTGDWGTPIIPPALGPSSAMNAPEGDMPIVVLGSPEFVNTPFAQFQPDDVGVGIVEVGFPYIVLSVLSKVKLEPVTVDRTVP